jgi:predicted ATPase
VVDKVHGRRGFSIGISGPAFHCDWTFESGAEGAGEARSADREDIAVRLAKVSLRTGGEELFHQAGSPPSLLPPHSSLVRASLAKLVERITYVSAERMGPRETYPLFDPSRHETVGPRGERAPGKLYWYENDEVLAPMRYEEEPAPTLYKQTQAWLSDFFPGASFDVQRVLRANLVTLGIRTSADTDHHRPQHVGFGLTHVLPILVACLHARREDLIIVENPEVHLHPVGQMRMGMFLARVAKAGVQVLVETHSDHVLNGLRRAVKTEILSPEQAALYFFQPRGLAEQRKEAQVISPRLDRAGNIDHWPDGFFDQFDKDMSYFAGLG